MAATAWWSPASCSRGYAWSLHVVPLAEPGELKGDAAANYAMLLAARRLGESGILATARCRW
jgi:hypothetical protein